MADQQKTRLGTMRDRVARAAKKGTARVQKNPRVQAGVNKAKAGVERIQASAARGATSQAGPSPAERVGGSSTRPGVVVNDTTKKAQRGIRRVARPVAGLARLAGGIAAIPGNIEGTTRAFKRDTRDLAERGGFAPEVQADAANRVDLASVAERLPIAGQALGAGIRLGRRVLDNPDFGTVNKGGVQNAASAIAGTARDIGDVQLENVQSLLGAESASDVPPAAGLRERQVPVSASNMPARGQGFIQNQRTKKITLLGQRSNQETDTAPASSPGLRQRTLASRQTGNAFADVALGFGDATRAAIQEGRGQADRARSQRLRESAIENLPEAQKTARQAEQDTIAADEAEDKRFTELNTELSALDIDSPERQRRLADMDAEARRNPKGGENRVLMAEALREMGESDERGIGDFIKSAFSSGFPPEQFLSFNGLFLDNNVIKQQTSEGKFNDIANIDDLSEISKNTVLRMMTDISEGK